MPKFKGIALLGEPGSGKTSIAQAIADLTGWQRATFAMALKKEAAAGLVAGAFAMNMDSTPTAEDFSREWRNSSLFVLQQMLNPETKDQYRPLLQAWGVLRREQAGEDYWVRQIDLDPEGTVVDDCRFWNEYHYLRQHGFAFVRLASGATTRPLTGEQAEHASEKDWPNFPTEFTLSYQPGPETQAFRIMALLNIPLLEVVH